MEENSNLFRLVVELSPAVKDKAHLCEEWGQVVAVNGCPGTVLILRLVEVFVIDD